MADDRGGASQRGRRTRGTGACRLSSPTAFASPSSTRAQGEPILLIHGFASSVRYNWIEPGWVTPPHAAWLSRRRLGQSRSRGERKALRSNAYAAPANGRGRTPPAGSSGHRPRPTSWATRWARASPRSSRSNIPERVRSAIFGGLGGNMVRPMAGTGPIAHALEAASIDQVTNADRPYLSRFRREDRQRSAARLRRASAVPASPSDARDGGHLQCPVLVVTGTRGCHRRLRG